MYIVTINNTYTGLKFKFRNFDDAMSFAGMVVENGEYDGTVGAEKVRATLEEVDD